MSIKRGRVWYGETADWTDVDYVPVGTYCVEITTTGETLNKIGAGTTYDATPYVTASGFTRLGSRVFGLGPNREYKNWVGYDTLGLSLDDGYDFYNCIPTHIVFERESGDYGAYNSYWSMHFGDTGMYMTDVDDAHLSKVFTENKKYVFTLYEYLRTKKESNYLTLYTPGASEPEYELGKKWALIFERYDNMTTQDCEMRISIYGTLI